MNALPPRKVWRAIRSRAPVEGYDLVLYLGVHQHLSPSVRRAVLERLLELTRDRLAVRMPSATFEGDQLGAFLEQAGFALEQTAAPREQSFAGPVHIFRRRA